MEKWKTVEPEVWKPQKEGDHITGRLELEPSDIPLKELLESSMSMIQEKIMKQRIQLSLDIYFRRSIYIHSCAFDSNLFVWDRR